MLLCAHTGAERRKIVELSANFMVPFCYYLLCRVLKKVLPAFWAGYMAAFNGGDPWIVLTPLYLEPKSEIGFGVSPTPK